MAGYVTKLMGHVYDGANLSGEALTALREYEAKKKLK